MSASHHSTGGMSSSRYKRRAHNTYTHTHTHTHNTHTHTHHNDVQALHLCREREGGGALASSIPGAMRASFVAEEMPVFLAADMISSCSFSSCARALSVCPSRTYLPSNREGAWQTLRGVGQALWCRESIKGRGKHYEGRGKHYEGRGKHYEGRGMPQQHW